jgi:curved DNA-binding protein CbpA
MTPTVTPLRPTAGADNQNLYEVLGLPQVAGRDLIEKQCIQLGEHYRPDKNPGDLRAALIFAQIEKAYETLLDPVKRAAYDAELLRQPPGYSSRAPHVRRSNNGVAMNEIQKKIVIGAIGVIVAMLFYPPFSFHGPNGFVRNIGYGFLFDPPSYYGGTYWVPGTVDIPMLLVQWFAVAVVAAALWWLTKDKG